MAVESKRGCGYRKVGGLYLCASGAGISCCRLPLALHTCPVCSGGIKQARGWTWINPAKMFAEAPPATCGTSASFSLDRPGSGFCPNFNLANYGERVGLLWVGESFYKTPTDFNVEAGTLGISRRIIALPRGFKLGEHWVFIAHPKVIPAPRTVAEVDGVLAICDASGEPTDEGTFIEDRAAAEALAAQLDREKPRFGAAVFRVFKPTAIEKIIDQSDYDALLAELATYEADAAENKVPSKRLAKFIKERAAGVTFVPVPDDDPDHHGDVHEDRAAERKRAKELAKAA